jgi:hypothetical protein
MLGVFCLAESYIVDLEETKTETNVLPPVVPDCLVLCKMSRIDRRLVLCLRPSTE